MAYQLVTTATAPHRKNYTPKVHIVKHAANGGVSTFCGIPFAEGGHRTVDDGLSCERCCVHAGLSVDDRKPFVRHAYPGKR